jgi:hypothetical protein
MQVQFNRPATIGGVTYGKGQHAVPDEHKDDWFFKALVQDGDAVVLRAENAPAPAVAPVAEADWSSMDEVMDSASEDYCAILDGSTKEISAAIAGASLDKLQALLAAETAGKTRKSVVKLLEEAIGAQ